MIIQYNNHWTSTHRKTHRMSRHMAGKCPTSVVRRSPALGKHGGFLNHGDTPSSLDGLFHGTSENNMDEKWVSPWIGNVHMNMYW